MLHLVCESVFVFRMNALEMSSESISCVCIQRTMTNPKFGMKIIQIVSSTHFVPKKIIVLKEKKSISRNGNINGIEITGSN